MDFEGRVSPSASIDSKSSAESFGAGLIPGSDHVVIPLSDNPYTVPEVSAASSKKSSVSQAPSIPFLHPYGASATTYPGPGSMRLPNPPSLVQFDQMRFLIMDAPSETNLHLYIREMERYNVSDIVRVCDPSYPKDVVEKHGIKVHELIFPDGEAPPEAVVNYWLGLVESRFGHPKAVPVDGGEEEEPTGVTIAIHCVAGLGRAPVLVAIALIESGMSPFDAISYIRERRRGAINTRQLKFLETYRRRGKSAQTKCCIM